VLSGPKNAIPANRHELPVTNSFCTDRGRVVLDSERLRIEDAGRGWLATLRDALTSEEIPGWRRAAVVLCYLALLAGATLLLRVAPAWLSGGVLALLLAVVAWSLYRGRGRTTGSLAIPRENVVDVTAHRGLALVTRSRFVVRYRSEGGVKHRHLRCPSRFYGFGAYEAGRELFDRHGLLEEDAAGNGMVSQSTAE